MNSFLLAAGLLSALVFLVLVPPVWRVAGGSRGLALAAPCGLVVFAAGLYALLGTPAGLDTGLLTTRQADTMVSQLAARLKSQPDNAKGWLLLARSQTLLGHVNEAGQAYAQLLRLEPDNPDVLSAYAEVLSVAQGKSLQGEPERLLLKALRLAPDHGQALFLAGGAHFERSEFTAAIARWRQIDEEDPLYEEAVRNIAAARTRMDAAVK
ncbi:MAG: tetratricopeptide repeat protein [Massilia sp.]